MHILSVLAALVISAASTLHANDEAEVMQLPAGSAVWVGPAEASPDSAIKLSAEALRHIGPGSTLVNVDASGVDVTGWKAAGLTIRGGTFEKAKLAKADLAKAVFDHVTMDEAVFDGANMSGTVINCAPGVVFMGCQFGTTLSMKGANLTGASIVGPTEAFEIAFDKAVIDGTHVAARPDIAKVLSAATVKSVVLEAPIFRQGEPQSFSADELERIGARGFGAFIDAIEEHPSFKCGGPMSAAEKTICKYPELVALDQLMQRTYKRLTAKKDDQLAFIKKRNTCALDDIECVATAYVARLAELSGSLDALVRERLQRGQIGYTAGPVIAKSSDPIAIKLAKAYGIRSDGATLEPDFHLDAGATGSNAHVCSFNAVVERGSDGFYRDNNNATAPPWVILPDGMAIGGSTEQQRGYCGARAAWPGAFFSRDP